MESPNRGLSNSQQHDTNVVSSLPNNRKKQSLPHGVIPLTHRDGSTTYNFQGQEYSSLEDVPVKTWPWLNKAGEFAGNVLMSSPTIRAATNVLGSEPVQDALSMPGEETFAHQLGLSAQKWGAPYNVGKGLGYAVWPGPGEFRHPPKFLKKGLNPAFATVNVNDSMRINRFNDNLDTPNYYAAHSGLGTGQAGRARKKDVTGPGSPADHRRQGEYWDAKRKTSLTNVHHGGGLEDQGRAATAHGSYIPGERSKVVTHAENFFGIRGGNWKENLVDILEHKTNLSRQSRVNQIYEQLDGTVHPQTIDDLLGTSDLKIQEYTPKQLDARREFKQLYPDKEYPKELMFGNIKSKKIDKFPEVKIRNSDGKVIDTWQAKNIDEYERRFEIITEKFYGGKKKINRKAIKIDPTLDIFSSDHVDTHNLIRKFRQMEGNPLNVLETAIENGTYKNMPVGQAGKLYADAHKFQESIAAAVLKARYKKMEGLWLKMYNPHGKGFRGAQTLNDWDKAAKQKFFKENVAAIGRAGGLKKGVTPADVFLDASEGWTPGMTDVFGWSPTKDITPPKLTNIKEIKRLGNNGRSLLKINKKG